MTDKERARRKARYEDAKKAYAALMKFYPFTTEDLDGEQWADIAGYEGFYQVSTFGRTKSFKRYASGKILKPTLRGGYLIVTLQKEFDEKHFLVHRIVAKTFISNVDDKPQVNHVDGHPLNCHVSNLEWATASENQRHAYTTGLQTALNGEDYPYASLTNGQAEWIRLNPSGLNINQLAEMFAVAPQTISKIQLGQKYKNANGIIRKPQTFKLSVEIREEIRRVYKKGDKQFGARPLAKKYGVSNTTIKRIVNEK